jgi:Protein of unknown function (DUF3102)
MSKKKRADDVRAVPKLTKITNHLHEILKRETGDVVEIGRLLTSAKEELGHGEFLPWLEREFSLSEKTANRYMAAHKFMIEVAAPLLKSDKLSDLSLRPSALHELVGMKSRGELRDDDGNVYTVTQADIEAVLKEAAENWVGRKRLLEILKSRHPRTTEANGDRGPEAAGEETTGEPADMATSTEAPGEAGDGESEQSTETPPHPAPKPKSAPSMKDEDNLSTFSASIKDLKRLATVSAEKYAEAAVPTADLERVADFVRAVADLKKQGNAEISISAEASAERRKAQYAEAEAA